MLFNPTVYDEVLYVPRQLCRDFIEKIAREAIKAVGLPEWSLSKRVHELSYGENKLVALASIISFKPKLLLLDELFEGLSRKARAGVTCIIKGLIKGEQASCWHHMCHQSN